MDAKQSETSSREIATTRTFDAPRELVWKVWSDPNHVEKWWGPNGFTTTTKKHDLRPGGQWLFTMQGPDGTDYRNEVTYTNVTEPERLEWDHGPSPIFHTTVVFREEGAGRTHLSMRMLFETAGERHRAIEKFGAIEGQSQTLARLKEYLTKM